MQASVIRFVIWLAAIALEAAIVLAIVLAITARRVDIQTGFRPGAGAGSGLPPGCTASANAVDCASGSTYVWDFTNSGLGVFTLRVDGSLVWNEGNDGAGSTLDADFLDGKSSQAFMQLAEVNVLTATGKIRIDEDLGCSAPVITGDVRTTSGINVVNSDASVQICRSGSEIARFNNGFNLSADLTVTDDARTFGGASTRIRRVYAKFHNSPSTAQSLTGPTSSVTPLAGAVRVTADSATAWTPGVTSIADGDMLTICNTDAADTITLTEGATYLGTCALVANTNSCASAVAITNGGVLWAQVSCSAN